MLSVASRPKPPPGYIGRSGNMVNPEWWWFWSKHCFTALYQDPDLSLIQSLGDRLSWLNAGGGATWGQGRFGPHRVMSISDANDKWTTDTVGATRIDYGLPTTWWAILRRTGSSTTATRIINLTETDSSNKIAGLIFAVNGVGLRLFIRDGSAGTIVNAEDTNDVKTPLNQWVLAVGSYVGYDTGFLSGQQAAWYGTFNFETGLSSISYAAISAQTGNCQPIHIEIGGWDRNGYGLNADVAAAGVLQRFTKPDLWRQFAADPFGPFYPALYEYRTGVTATPPSLDGFRFYDDDGSESAATAAANEDTNHSEGAGTVIRLRTQVANPSAGQYGLEYRKKGETGAWTPVPPEAP